MTRLALTLSTVVVLLTCVSRSVAALPAFPGAEGFGSATPGGRGGAVVEVTSLADTGPGSLRAALEDGTGPRTVVFRTSGTISLSQHIHMRGESDSFVTVAGQTAPGEGIQLANYGIQISAGAHDIVLRYLRIRPSNGPGDFHQDIDAVELWGSDGTNVHDIVIDHCSLEWAMDENMSAWDHVTDVTVQRTIIAEAEVDGQDHEYAKGILIGADPSAAKPDRFSFHHLLFAHNPDRNPRVAYAVTDFRNNIIYDWGGNNSTLLGPYGSFPPGPHSTDVNLVNNVWKKGPSTYADYNDVSWLHPNTRIFPLGNYAPKCATGCADEWQIGFRDEFGGYGPADPSIYRVAAPFVVPPVTTYATSDLTTILLANVGASLPARDEVDARIVQDVVAGTRTIGQGSGYPTLDAAPPPADADHDGMPDDWELAHGLSPADPDDRNGDLDGDGYTNLEEYLNEIGPTEFGCGDGITHAGEACDDGNATDGDGCDSNCTPTSCGNGIKTAGEACDDGNNIDGDCCSATCQLESFGATCDDGELCTIGDACDGAGTCRGGAGDRLPRSCERLVAPRQRGQAQLEVALGRGDHERRSREPHEQHEVRALRLRHRSVDSASRVEGPNAGERHRVEGARRTRRICISQQERGARRHHFRDAESRYHGEAAHHREGQRRGARSPAPAPCRRSRRDDPAEKQRRCLLDPVVRRARASQRRAPVQGRRAVGLRDDALTERDGNRLGAIRGAELLEELWRIAVQGVMSEVARYVAPDEREEAAKTPLEFPITPAAAPAQSVLFSLLCGRRIPTRRAAKRARRAPPITSRSHR